MTPRGVEGSFQVEDATIHANPVGTTHVDSQPARVVKVLARFVASGPR